MRVRFIYHLVDADGALRYVGASVHPSTRSVQHARESGVRVKAWMQLEIAAGRRPTVKVVRPCGADWREDERREINAMLDDKHHLLNTVSRSVVARAWMLPHSDHLL